MLSSTDSIHISKMKHTKETRLGKLTCMIAKFSTEIQHHGGISMDVLHRFMLTTRIFCEILHVVCGDDSKENR